MIETIQWLLIVVLILYSYLEIKMRWDLQQQYCDQYNKFTHKIDTLKSELRTVERKLYFLEKYEKQEG